MSQRARIVLLAADGLANAEIARRTGSTSPTVLAWRNRYRKGGISALVDQPRTGRPTKVDEIEIVATTLADDGRPPEHLGAKHWSSRLLGQQLGISPTTVARVWRKWGIEPSNVGTFKFVMDPELEAELRGVIGAHPDSPERAVVLPRRGFRSRPAAAQSADQHEQQSDPWLDLVEVSLSVITYQAIRRGTFQSVRNLLDAIGALTDEWNDRCECITVPDPAGAHQDQADRKTTSGTRHVCRRTSRVEIDLRRAPDRMVGKPRNRMSLRAEFHGPQCQPGEQAT
ncbi:MAG TPA: helix-turn-helix domain-containing protein [Pseudonocardiaceae bacterium]